MSQGIKKKVQKQKKGSGRPPKKQQQADVKMEGEELWFFHQDLVQIVQYLGKRGQILLKSLSGQVPSGVKTFLENNKVNSSETFKKKRQEFSDALNQYQNFILTRLGYEQDKKYMLMGENLDKVNFTSVPNQKFLLLTPILDPRFLKTFQCIINQQELIRENHKMLYDWATIMILTQQGRELLHNLQTLENQDIINNYQGSIQYQKDFMKGIQDQNRFPQVDGIEDFIDEFKASLFSLIKQVQ
ncbi:hypothetical protein pb186bvf_017448 [Paramecium bursaria]